MISFFDNAPKAKEKSVASSILILILSFICSIFILSPVFVFLIKNENPLTEMPENKLYYLFRGLFGISLLVSGVIFSLYKKLSVTFIPATFGLITAIFPLMYRINKYKEYKSVIEKSSMTADYTPYLSNASIYILFLLLAISYMLYISGIFRANISILIFTALSATAVIFLTIDRSKTIEHEIYNIFDILCFVHNFIVCILPSIIVFSTKKTTNNEQNNRKVISKRYKPRRMK